MDIQSKVNHLKTFTEPSEKTSAVNKNYAKDILKIYFFKRSQAMQVSQKELAMTFKVPLHSTICEYASDYFSSKCGKLSNILQLLLIFYHLHTCTLEVTQVGSRC